jgi:flagellar basal-body rod modification protein FlgD
LDFPFWTGGEKKMDITSVTSALNQDYTAATDDSKNTLTRDDFLNLLITQMQYQDPLDPMDNNEMATQLAQFNMVESLAEISDTLNEMMTNQTSWNNLQASSLIGKTIQAEGSSLSIEDGKVSSGAYQLSQAGNVTILISDSNGNVVRQIDSGSKDTSLQSVEWDGKNQQGSLLSDGIYYFQVLATDANGQSISVTSYLLGTVDGVTFDNGVAVYQVCGEEINFSDILSISI